jgi:hypothetical protein
MIPYIFLVFSIILFLISSVLFRIFFRTYLKGALLLSVGGILGGINSLIFFLNLKKILISSEFFYENKSLLSIRSILSEISFLIDIIGILMLVTIESGRLNAALRGVPFLKKITGNVPKLSIKEKYKPILKRWQGFLFGIILIIIGGAIIIYPTTPYEIKENLAIIILGVGLIIFSCFLKQ